MNENELRKKYMEYKVLDEKIKELHSKIEAAQQQLNEADLTMDSLKSFSKESQGKEILIPVTNGIFIKATLNKVDKFLVNVGAGVVVDRDLPTTLSMIQGQKEKIKKAHDQIATKINIFAGKATEIEQYLDTALKE